MAKVVDKRVKLTLAGLDGNAFFLLGKFQKEARRQKWKKEEIDAVCNEAMSGDYDHLLATLVAHTEEEDSGEYGGES
jgi:hypothetical protein